MKKKLTNIILLLIIILLVVGIILVTIDLFNNKDNNIYKEQPIIKDNTQSNTENNINKEIKIEKIDFINTIKELDKNKTYQVNLNIYPENANNINIKYSTNDINICTINNNGLLKAINKGTCIINVENENINNSLTINIYNSKELKNINVDKDNYTIEVNKESKININTTPSNAEYNNISCTSSNNNIFSVSTDGKACKLIGLNSGNAQLTIKVDNFTKTINIKTIKKEQITVATINIGRGKKFSNLTHTNFSNYLKGLDIIGMQETRDSNGTEKLVKNIAKDLGLKYYYGTKAPAGNAVISKFDFIEKTETKLPSPNETRTIIKTVFKINNVNISFYDTHIVVSKHEGGSCTASIEDTSKCPYRVKELKEINKMIQNDPNPVIIVADWNFLGNQWFSILGDNLIKVGYDTIRNKDYDSIWIIPKDKIEYVSNDTIETKDKITDHNLVISKLNIIN